MNNAPVVLLSLLATCSAQVALATDITIHLEKPGVAASPRSTERSSRTSTAYPPVGQARFEDPVVWKDDIQCNLIVNGWS